MRRFVWASLLGVLLALQPACKAKETPPSESGGAVSSESSAESAREKTPVIVCLTAKAVDVTPVTVKSNKKQDLFWKSHDEAYTLRFLETMWGFAESPDGEEVVGGVKYFKVSVPAKGLSRAFTIKKNLPAGSGEDYHYRVDYEPPVGPPDSPNGPVIIGEG